MHELQITEQMLNIVIQHGELNRANKILSVQLEIGRLRDFEPEWIQKYFDHLSKGTIAEGAALDIEWIPARVECRSCGHRREVDLRNLETDRCIRCGAETCSLISGTEYRVKNIGVI